MAIKKRPVKESHNPSYPELKKASIKRRRFLMLVGAAASAKFLPSCYDSNELDKEKDTDQEWSTDDIMGGDIAPEFYTLQLPASGEHQLVLGEELSYPGGRAILAYRVWVQYENYNFGSYAVTEEERILALVDEILIGYTAQELSTEDGVEEAGKEIRDLLEQLYKDSSGLSPAILAARLDVVSLTHTIPIDDPEGGDIAVEFYDNRLPTSGSDRTRLASGHQLDYAVFLQHESYDFFLYLQNNEASVRTEIRSFLAQFRAKQFEDTQALSDVSARLQQKLLTLFEKEKGLNAWIAATRIDVISIS